MNDASLGQINRAKTTIGKVNINNNFAKGACTVSSLPSQAQPGGRSTAIHTVIKSRFQESLALFLIELSEQASNMAAIVCLRKCVKPFRDIIILEIPLAHLQLK